LQKEAQLLEIVQLVGSDALPESEKALLKIGQMLREDYLQQFAFHDIDGFCPPTKQYWMLRVILTFHRELSRLIKRGATLEHVVKTSAPVSASINAVLQTKKDKSSETKQVDDSTAISSQGTLLERAMVLPVVGEIARMKEWQPADAETRGRELIEQVENQLAALH
jgi:V/A-type H+-transporting ATPase subunit A